MLFLLDKATTTSKWNGTPLYEARSAIIKESLNGDFMLTVRYPITDSGVYKLFQEDKIIKAPVPIIGPQLFRLKKPVEMDNEVELTCYHISDDVMKQSVQPLSCVQLGCQAALNQVVQSLKTPINRFSLSSNISSRHTYQTTETKTLYSVLLEGAHSVVGTWEGELIRDNFSISIKQNRGVERSVILSSHHNLKSFKRIRSSSSVITRIHAKSTFRPEGADTERTISVTVDSPLIGSYPYINEAEYTNNNCETVADLREWAKNKFRLDGIDKVNEQITVEAYKLEGQEVHIGDTVFLKSRKHSVDMKKKVVAYEFDALAETYISLTFDDKAKPGTSQGSSNPLSSVASQILDASDAAQEIAIQRAIENSNRAFDATFEKQKEALEDGIEQAKAEAARYADKVKSQVDATLNQFNQNMTSNVQTQQSRYNELLAKTQSNASLVAEAKQLSIQVKTIAEEARTDAQNLFNESRASIQIVKEDLNRAKTDLTNKVQGLDGIKTIVTNLETATGGTLKTIQQLQSSNGTLSNRIATTETGLNGVQTRLENIWTGAKNLLADSEKLSDQRDVMTQTFNGRPYMRVMRAANATTYSEGYHKQISEILLNPKEMILSFYARATRSNTMISCYFYNPNSSKTALTSEGQTSTTTDGAVSFPIGTAWKRYWVKYTFNSNMTGQPRIIIGRLNQQETHVQTVYIHTPALYYGHHNKEWSASDTDVVNQFATYEQTLSRHLAEVGEKFTTVNNQLTTQSTKIDQNATSLALKASSSELNTLKNKALTAESAEIKLLKNKVATIVTRTDIDSMITGKGYVTTTSLSQTASDFNKKITAVQSDVTRFQSVKETVDAYSRVIGTNGDTLSEIKQQTDSYKRSVASGGAISQVIQTSQSLVSRVGNLEGHLPNLVYDPTNFSKYRQREANSNLVMTGTSDYKMVRITQNGLTANSYKGFQMPLHSSRFTKGEKISYRFTLWVDVLPDAPIGFEIKNGGTKILNFTITPTRTGAAQIFTGTVTVNTTTLNTDDFGFHIWLQKNGTVAFGQLMLVRGEIPIGKFYDDTSKQQIATETLVQQTAGSWSVQNLTSAGTLISSINLGANGTNRIDGRLTRITGQTLIDNAVIKSAMVDKLKTANFEAGSVTTTVLAANAVTAAKILVDQAFFNKLMANEAYLKQLFAKNAFITQVQAVTLSANKISGGILKATNNATTFNLTSGDLTFNTSSTITFNQSNNSLKRVRNGSTGFLHFNNSSAGGVFVGLGVTSHNEGVKSQDTGRFAGVRIFRDNDTNDQLELYGDKIVLGHAFGSSASGVWVRSTKLKTNLDLIDFLRWCRTEILRLHDHKTTEKGYNYTRWGDF